MNDQRLIDASLRPLIRFFEQIYLQNVVMKRMLDGVPNLDWKTKLLEGLRDIENEEEVTRKFSKLYRSLGNGVALHDVIQEFLGIKHSQ